MNAVQLFQPSTSAIQLTSADKLLHDLSTICDDEFWSDIEVKVQGKSFQCHKIILAARSLYFNERLKSDRHQTEIVEDGNEDAFELIRRYIYTGAVDHDQADLELIANVLSMSLKYKLDELSDCMSDQIRKRIAAPNAVKVFGLMSDLKMNSMAEECLEFIRTHSDDCLQSENYFDLSLSQIVKFLKNVNLDAETQWMVIGRWSKKHPGVDAAKLFQMLDGEIDCPKDQQKGKTSDTQYLLMNYADRKMVILDAKTFQEVATKYEPTILKRHIAVSNEILYVISSERGEILSTPVSGLLNSQPIEWDKCASLQLSKWSSGNVAVVDTIIYFMDRTHLWKYNTVSKTVTQLHEFGIRIGFYSIVEVNGLIYGWVDNRFQVTDGISEWKPIHLPTSFGRYPYSGSLIKVQDSVCLVGGYDGRGGYCRGMLCYDTNTKTWTKGNSINQARCEAATVSLDGGRSLLIEGYNGQWVDTIELFDHKSKQWSLVDYKVKLDFPRAVTFYA